MTLTRVEPLVAEISADVVRSGNAFRHAVRCLRPRPEFEPEDMQLSDRQPGWKFVSQVLVVQWASPAAVPGVHRTTL